MYSRISLWFCSPGHPLTLYNSVVRTVVGASIGLARTERSTGTGAGAEVPVPVPVPVLNVSTTVLNFVTS